jgi:hypothetical protein
MGCCCRELLDPMRGGGRGEAKLRAERREAPHSKVEQRVAHGCRMPLGLGERMWEPEG